MPRPPRHSPRRPSMRALMGLGGLGLHGLGAAAGAPAAAAGFTPRGRRAATRCASSRPPPPPPAAASPSSPSAGRRGEQRHRRRGGGPDRENAGSGRTRARCRGAPDAADAAQSPADAGRPNARMRPAAGAGARAGPWRRRSARRRRRRSARAAAEADAMNAFAGRCARTRAAGGRARRPQYAQRQRNVTRAARVTGAPACIGGVVSSLACAMFCDALSTFWRAGKKFCRPNAGSLETAEIIKRLQLSPALVKLPRRLVEDEGLRRSRPRTRRPHIVPHTAEPPPSAASVSAYTSSSRRRR